MASADLSPLSVFQVANRLAPLMIDAELSAPEPSKQGFFSIPDYLSREEARASVLVFLNKLKLSSCSARLTCEEEVDKLSHVLDMRSFRVSVSSENLDFSEVIFVAISALLNYRSSALASVVDVVAALACEALGADVSAFDLTDSGDGSAVKDEVSVASDFKIFFNGSKFVQDGKLVDKSVSDIPAVHGSFREVCRLLHSWTCAQLNSPFRCGTGTVTAISATQSSLALTLLHLAERSCRRAELLADSITMDGGELRVCLEKLRPVDGNWIKETYLASQDALERKDYVMFSHTILSLLEGARKAVSWEATLALVLLDDSSSAFLVASSKGTVPANGEEKKKKKKAMGKGTASFMQFIKETMLHEKISKSIQPFALLEKRTWDSLSFLNPVRSEFDSLQKKVKSIVESNETRRKPKLPKGTRDFANEQMALRERAFSIVANVFKRHGATRLDTPVFELRETLTGKGKYGEESKLIYDLADQGGELCSLRYDLTVPFARFVGMNDLKSLKRYQIDKVYRRDNPAKGRSREFYQCDLDIAGQFEKMGPDFEVIKILTELLNELNIGDYEVKLNHRKLLDGMMAICGVPSDKFRTICSSIDKLDKQSFDQIKKEMVNEKGLSEETADAIGTFVKEKGSPMDLLSKLIQEGRFRENAESLLALDELEILFKALQKAKCDGKVVFDLSLARGLDYYTGVIFEAAFKGTTQVGSIGAGGRYDALIESFGGKRIPAVGVSLGIERVFTIMEELHRNESIRPTETQVLVSILGDDLSVATELVSELWDANVKAEFMLHKRLMKHFERANDARIPWMIIVGENELREGKVKLKDLVAAVEIDVPRSTFVEEIFGRLNVA